MYAVIRDQCRGRAMCVVIWLILWITPGYGIVRDSLEVRKIMQLADSLQARYAPDKRTAVFELVTDSMPSLSFWLETTEKEAADAFLREKARLGVRVPVVVRLLPDPESGLPAAGI